MSDGASVGTASLYHSNGKSPWATERTDPALRFLPSDLAQRMNSPEVRAEFSYSLMMIRGLGVELTESIGRQVAEKLLRDIDATIGQYDERKLRFERREREGQLIYYIRFGDRVKIGTTTNLASRLASVPHDEVLATEPGGLLLERLRHEQFEAYRIAPRSEWFHVHDELLSHVDMLRSAAA